ncbi:MAG TPA: hypothetical protein VFH68_22585 [Polyangia bacterium]|jgi:hypothetical protein|nr:hypothetical protein [Polyangia bacterium]
MKPTWSHSWPLGPLLVFAICVSACATTGEGEMKPPDLPPPPPRPTPDQETQTVIGSVQKSGEVAPDIQPILFKAAEAAFGQTFDNPDPSVVQIDRGGCFGSGCLFFVTYHDRCAADAFKQRLTDVAAARLRDWPGTIYQTPPMKMPDGRIRVTWALLLAETPNRRARLEALLQPAPPVVGVLKPDVCVRLTPASAGVNPSRPPTPGVK